MKHNQRSKERFVSFFLLFIILGLAIVSLSRQWLILAQAKSIASTAQEPPSNSSFPVAMVSAVQVAFPAKELLQTATIAAPKAMKALPEAHLKIPKLGVNAVIKDMGVTPDGLMAVPDNRVDVGWYSLGTLPGDTGSAVIGAHVNFGAQPGVFVHLDQLKKGDVLSVVSASGASISFVVRDTEVYDRLDGDTGVFDSKSGIHLNLITCDGDWEPSAKTYGKRLVVFTDAI